ncbi:MAG: glycosyltransferase family 2 protein [Bacilli bacterium]|nr:glycosyltransferase family 2 protein [Bacilli bacterium]
MDKISIIIPIYNCEEFLNDCLDSIVRQSFKNIEVILINDGTKDNSDAICREYRDKYKWTFIDRKVNKGLAYTRNEGIKNSTGKYVMFLDSDDLLYDNAVELLYKSITRNKSDMVISKINSFNSKGEYGYYSDKFLKKESTFNVYDNKKIINCISVCGKLYKKSLLNGIEFIPGTYHEDNYFTLKILFNANSISVLPEYTYYRRIREGENKSIMQNLNYKTFNDLIKNFESFLSDNEGTIKGDFVYDFMMRKSINYIVMNINTTEDYKNCKKTLNDFSNFICGYGIQKPRLFKLKFYIYFKFAKLYKLMRQ